MRSKLLLSSTPTSTRSTLVQSASKNLISSSHHAVKVQHESKIKRISSLGDRHSVTSPGSIRSRFYSTRNSDDYFYSNSPSIKNNDNSSTSQSFKSVFFKSILNLNPSTEPEMVDLIENASRITLQEPDQQDWQVAMKVLLGWKLKLASAESGREFRWEDESSEMPRGGNDVKGKGRQSENKAVSFLLKDEIIELNLIDSGSDQSQRVLLESPSWHQALIKELYLDEKVQDQPQNPIHFHISPNSLHESYLFYRFYLDRRKKSKQTSDGDLLTIHFSNLLIQANCSTFLPNLDLAFQLYNDLKRENSLGIHEEIYGILLLTCVKNSEIYRTSKILDELKTRAQIKEMEIVNENGRNGRDYWGLGRRGRTRLLIKLLGKSRNFKEAWDFYLTVLSLGKVFGRERGDFVSDDLLGEGNENHSASNLIAEERKVRNENETIAEDGSEKKWIGSGPFHSYGWNEIIEAFMGLRFPSGEGESQGSFEEDRMIAKFVPPKSWMKSFWKTSSSKEEFQDQESDNPSTSTSDSHNSTLQTSSLSSAPPELFLFLLKDMTLNGRPPTNFIYSKILSYYSNQCKFLNSSTSPTSYSSLKSYQQSILNFHLILKADLTLKPDIGLITNLMKAYSFSKMNDQVFQIWFSLISTKSEINGNCLSVFLDNCRFTNSRDVGFDVLLEARNAMEWCKNHWELALNKGSMDSWIECLCRKGKLEEAFKVVFEDLKWEKLTSKKLNSDSSLTSLSTRLDKDTWPPRADVKTLEILLKFSARERDFKSRLRKSGDQREEKERELLEKLNQDKDLDVNSTSQIRPQLQSDPEFQVSNINSKSIPWTPYSSTSRGGIQRESKVEDYEGEPSLWHLARKRIEETYPWMWDEVKDVGTGNERDSRRRERERRKR